MILFGALCACIRIEMQGFPSFLGSPEDLSQEQIQQLLSLSKGLKKLKSNLSEALPSQTKSSIITLFSEDSTRTKLSFLRACELLGHSYIDLDPKASSFNKGEDQRQGLLTLAAQGFELAVVRTSSSSFFNQLKNNPPIKLINAGDGMNHHPTQALSDLLTFCELGIELENSTFCVMGDTLHSRVANSLVQLLTRFKAKVIICGPPALQGEHLLKFSGVSLSSSRDQAIEDSDFLYLLRVQRERHTQEDTLGNYHRDYGLTKEHLKFKKLIFHPGPANIGIEISKEAIESQFYMGHEQVKNSIYMRMAITHSILNNGDKEVERYSL